MLRRPPRSTRNDKLCPYTTLLRSRVGNAAAFLQDGMDVVMELHDEKPISVQLPDQIEAEVVEADAVVKGQTASSSYKPAVLDNGVRVLVPPHIRSEERRVEKECVSTCRSRW